VSEITLKVCDDFDFFELEKIYSNKSDLNLAFPSATFPIEKSEWLTWINNKDSKNYSLTFYENDEAIGHLALKNYTQSPGLCYLCFFCIKRSHRGQSLSSLILELTYDYCSGILGKSELWLVVDEQNTIAYSLYRREGFQVVDKKEAGFRMRKDLLR
jgi:RimJ/RimL family protein N-acetyltransferase